MIRVREIIVVEGKYDVNKVKQIVDGTVIGTSGFGIFKDKDKQKFIKIAAEKRGMVILTDSDSAGFVIRNFLKGIVPNEYIKNAYIPDIYGKEKRKRTASKEGKLGVEGIEDEIIIEALKRSGATIDDETAQPYGGITKTDMYSKGISGGQNSREKRKILQKRLELPAHMTSNALLEILNLTMTREEFMNMDL